MYKDKNNGEFLVHLTELKKIATKDTDLAKNKNQQYADAYPTHRQLISGSAGSVELVRKSTSRIQGVTDFHNGMLEDSQSMILKRVLVGYAVADYETNPGAVTYEYNLSKVPSALRNAELRIAQNGTTLKQISISKLMSETGVNAPVGMGSDFEWGNWDYLTGENSVEMFLVFPDGVTLDSAKKHFIEVCLGGDYIARIS